MVAIIKKPNIEEKSRILGADAKYDSTGIPKRIRCTADYIKSHFIYPAVGKKGECIPLFKVLQTNYCIHNCNYCCNRRDRDCLRAGFQPEELAGLFINYYRKGAVKGLFLTSAIYPSPNKAQERMLATVEILRNQYGYKGYIHSVVLPGVDPSYIEALGRYSDRLSLNLEVPKAQYLKRLAPTKDFQRQLWDGLTRIARFHIENRLSAGVTTQLVVGASGESDEEILDLAQDLYKNYRLSRVYYSGFEPVSDTPLSSIKPCPPMREVRLYQADFLIRRYGFKTNELVFNRERNLWLDKDPKFIWALCHPEFFPVEITTASYEELIRVPGIGIISAKRIIKERRSGGIDSIDKLRKLGVVIKRAISFITIRGKQEKTERCSLSSPANMEVGPQSYQLLLWEEL